jgi:RNA polymerase sigma-70 factor (ECF subfamily)
MSWRTRFVSSPPGFVADATDTDDASDQATGGSRASVDRDAEFAEFVRGASTSLHRTAYLLTGSRESAQDAVQTALTRVYLAWDRHEQWDNPTAYARQAVVNVVLTGQRRKWTGELPQAEMSDRVFGATADRSGDVVERDALRRALDALPMRMGTPVGTIKSLTARGLEALRGQLKEVAP